MMNKLDLYRNELALIVQYLNKAEARDKICRAIQFGFTFLSGGRPGTAYNVARNTALARKVFRLLKFLNHFQDLISPVDKRTPLLVVLLTKSKYALSSIHLFLDQFVWLGRSGIFKNRAITELIRRLSLFSKLGSSICAIVLELISFSPSKKTFLALMKSSMDIVTTIGMLKLVPWIVTPRITGAFGFTSSIISCYQLFPSRAKFKKP